MSDFKIIIDTREQRPWAFPPHIETAVGTLRAGDYALDGDDHFAIERKSANDFAGTVSTGWGRFIRELNRMDEAGFITKIIIIEADFEEFCFRTEQGRIIPPDHEHCRISPQFLKKRIAQLILRGVSVVFAGNAELASGVALSLFIERAEQIENKEDNTCK